jgi:gliding motility-associated-like protein
MFGCTSDDNNYDLFSITNLQLTNMDNDGENGLIIPEAFSPDNDGYNDKFQILGLEKYNKISIKIYNRWGNLIYSENSYQNNWDGKANSTMAVGKELPTGTYFYIITIRDINKEMSGYIFLKR